MLERIRTLIASLKLRSWRVRNADNIRQMIESVPALENDYERYFPLYHLRTAAFLFSLHEELDIASIFHSSSALALGLIIKLDQKLSCDEKAKIRFLSFYKIIEESVKKGLLDKENYQLANNVRLIRNGYIHFENMMAYFNRAIKYYRDRESVLSKYDTDEERKVVNIILNSQPIQPVPIPEIKWCTNPEAVKFLEERHSAFGSLMVKAMAEFYGDEISEEDILREYSRFTGFGFTTADASYCLNSTAKILTNIGILPS